MTNEGVSRALRVAGQVGVGASMTVLFGLWGASAANARPIPVGPSGEPMPAGAGPAPDQAKPVRISQEDTDRENRKFQREADESNRQQAEEDKHKEDDREQADRENRKFEREAEESRQQQADEDQRHNQDDREQADRENRKFQREADEATRQREQQRQQDQQDQADRENRKFQREADEATRQQDQQDQADRENRMFAHRVSEDEKSTGKRVQGLGRNLVVVTDLKTGDANINGYDLGKNAPPLAELLPKLKDHGLAAPIECLPAVDNCTDARATITARDILEVCVGGVFSGPGVECGEDFKRELMATSLSGSQPKPDEVEGRIWEAALFDAVGQVGGLRGGSTVGGQASRAGSKLPNESGAVPGPSVKTVPEAVPGPVPAAPGGPIAGAGAPAARAGGRTVVSPPDAVELPNVGRTGRGVPKVQDETRVPGPSARTGPETAPGRAPRADEDSPGSAPEALPRGVRPGAGRTVVSPPEAVEVPNIGNAGRGLPPSPGRPGPLAVRPIQSTEVPTTGNFGRGAKAGDAPGGVRSPEQGGGPSRPVAREDGRAKTLLPMADRCTPNSFMPGTLVLMADGSRKRIEDVRIGDRVVATDPATGISRAEPVSALITGSGHKDLVDITIDTDGDAGDQTGSVVATGGHPFWDDGRHRWVDAGELTAGELLRAADGRDFVITATRHHAAVQTVYNLSVADIHTYYVMAGNVAVLVHNAGCGEIGRDLIDGQAQIHIISGNHTGGGHKWPGMPGKTVFPPSWDTEKILDNVAEVVTNPKSAWSWQTGATGSLYTRAGDPSRVAIKGVADDGLPIKVIYVPATGRVITAYPSL